MGLLSQFSSKAEMHRRETIKRFDDFIGSYLERFARDANPAVAGDLRITMIARSPESPVAAALLRHCERFSFLGCELRMIFVKLEPAGDMSEFAELARVCNGEGRVAGAFRWARNPALLDAHEQLVMGADHCWSGDSMRRSSETRFALDLYDGEGGTAVDWARMAFDGLWSASCEVPRSYFRDADSKGAASVIANLETTKDINMHGIPFSASAVTRH